MARTPTSCTLTLATTAMPAIRHGVRWRVSVAYFWSRSANGHLASDLPQLRVPGGEVRARCSRVERKKERLIFPRYHQLDAVNAMLADAKVNGSGMPYLCEHSPGSGKTATIAWTATASSNFAPAMESLSLTASSSLRIETSRQSAAEGDSAVGQASRCSGCHCARTGQRIQKQAAGGVAAWRSPIIVVTIQTFRTPWRRSDGQEAQG